jgi:hypothetical protein
MKKEERRTRIGQLKREEHATERWRSR